ncbi:hypothetical protein Skr01_03630 [Sphaerisporangium krabiense]|uniref:Uncharacterized protein n=1 Tax=Sphaerisporangium krabiense TaxID=763782 RepID=A0A7W9DRT5_9ACTN|nr:hypothetical protein [Sphaerisporangium krabiense]MBB5628881.1 hypothetical protein [Sphaerisporangium krabiense]GII60278.1 hypothetical protein Skr01_03630 [Sphaerisporangium krabiense]
MVTSAQRKIDVREPLDRRLQELRDQETRRPGFLRDAAREVVGRDLAASLPGMPGFTRAGAALPHKTRRLRAGSA